MTHLQFETRFDQLVEAINEESKLPERQWVWVLESSIPGRLCVYSDHTGGYIVVYHSKEDAPLFVLNSNGVDTSVTPIQMSMESVLMQAAEQGPDFSGTPCRGVYVVPLDEYIEVEGKPDRNDKGFI